MTPLAVTGVGVVCPAGVGRAAFAEAMRSGARPASLGRPTTFEGSRYGARVAEVPDFDATKYLGDKGLRALDRLTKLLVVAARMALHDAGIKRDGAWAAGSPERVGLVVSNAYGSLEAITELDRVATLEDARYINPSRFPLTVSNTAAGYTSIWEDLRALNVSVSDGNCGALDAVACAHVLLEQGRAEALLVGGAEAMSEALALAFDVLGAVGEGAFLGEGAALFALEPVERARSRGAAIVSTILGYGAAFSPPEREAALVYGSSDAVARAIREALSEAGLAAAAVDVVVSGVSGLGAFDDAELEGIRAALGAGGDQACILAPKRGLGETLGAGGAMGMLAAATLLGDGAHAGPHPHALRGRLRASPRTALVTAMGYYGNASALVMGGPPR
jgi:3-oxoacyl-(acyl-carrier-protein) synthase